MRAAEIDWKAGLIKHWGFDAIDEGLPLDQQRTELKEDLAQVEYPSGVLLDVGWYPELSVDGTFVIQVVWPGEWEQPLFQGRARTVPDLKTHLAAAVKCAAGARRPAV